MSTVRSLSTKLRGCRQFYSFLELFMENMMQYGKLVRNGTYITLNHAAIPNGGLTDTTAC
jgi:hypothetical protein